MIGEKDTSPEFFLNMVKNNPNQKDLEALRVSPFCHITQVSITIL